MPRLKIPAVTPQQITKARGMKSHQLGSWFEDILKDHFNYMKAIDNLYWHRFPDSKTAGNIIAEQPADYLVKSICSGAMLVEAKASATHSSLRGCLSNNVSTGQALQHRLWNRAGVNPPGYSASLFIFCSVGEPLVEIWHGGYVAECRAKGKVLNKEISGGGLRRIINPVSGGLLNILTTEFF